ncbi:VanZ family protein [Anoxynatronum buryatiense]|uniref:VanZ like family protein n=1 Tax=Anoxynatronum buryatiense TaxID=489973 RepID=A0AA46AJJ2_9CLOT|nr:VanZ family protein [Anoxynatronum buryatiense]SMP61969.1 VanZ like family protein [Anoxynatronum buryatiense]
MRKTAWLAVVGLIAFLYTASSIPGLRVLPVLRHLNQLAAGMDMTFIRLADWLAARIPLNFGELGHLDTVTQDFLSYVRENPVVIEFFLRKLAHVGVFFLITLALFFLLYQYIASATLSIVLSFMGGFVLAVLDEYRQSFVPDRVASPVDVMIDMVGVSMAVLLIIFSLIITSGERQRFFRHGGLKKKLKKHRGPGRLSPAGRRLSGKWQKI